MKEIKKYASTTFRCTNVSSAFVRCIVTMDRALHIVQSHCAIWQSSQYSLLMSGVRDTAHLFVANPSFCWHRFDDQLDWRVLPKYRYDQSINVYLPISFEIHWVHGIVSTLVKILVAKPQLLVAYGRSSSALQNPGHIIVTDPSQHIWQSHLVINTDKLGFSTCVCIWDTSLRIHHRAAAFAGIPSKFSHTSDPHPRESDAETQLRYSWLSCGFRWWVFPGLWSKSRHNLDLPSSPEWASWIFIKPALKRFESLWMSYSSLGTLQKRQIIHLSACTLFCHELHILVCMILIMFA